jgi:formiminoglutamase
VPVVLGGGHETAYGHYLGHVNAGNEAAILNIDAHLDVRPYPNGGHSGSPFRQAFEHATHPLAHGRYAVIGAQRSSVSHAHYQWASSKGARIHWAHGPDPDLVAAFRLFCEDVRSQGRPKLSLLLTIDADAFAQADVPGCSAPNPLGLPGRLGPVFSAMAAGYASSMEIVEVNPLLDRDGQTARWAAQVVRQFLAGLLSPFVV